MHPQSRMFQAKPTLPARQWVSDLILSPRRVGIEEPSLSRRERVAPVRQRDPPRTLRGSRIHRISRMLWNSSLYPPPQGSDRNRSHIERLFAQCPYSKTSPSPSCVRPRDLVVIQPLRQKYLPCPVYLIRSFLHFLRRQKQYVCPCPPIRPRDHPFICIRIQWQRGGLTTWTRWSQVGRSGPGQTQVICHDGNLHKQVRGG